MYVEPSIFLLFRGMKMEYWKSEFLLTEESLYLQIENSRFTILIYLDPMYVWIESDNIRKAVVLREKVIVQVQYRSKQQKIDQRTVLLR